MGPALARGAFLPAGGVLTLEPRAGTNAAERFRFWEPRPVREVEGWEVADRGWFTEPPRSTMRFPGDLEGEAELLVAFRNRPPADAVAVGLTLDGGQLDPVVVAPGRSRFRVPLEAPVAAGDHLLELTTPPATRIELTRVGLVEAGAPDPSPPPPDAAGWDPTVGELAFARSGIWVAPLRLPTGSERFEFEWRLSGEGELALGAILPDGEERELWRSPSGGAGGWARAQVDAHGLAGTSVFLIVRAELAGEPGRAEIRTPTLLARADGAETVVPVAEPGTQPDVVVVVLDAARGDRFDGSYGRETSPNLDAVARDGIVFRRAYSECPTTSCSIPNLITGLPFLEVGETFRGWRVADEVRTLAEYLSAAGYRTVGMSANPSNSASRNCHQGFDDFRQLWGDHPHRGPYGMSELAVEAIRGQPAGEPLYLQLHYLPPHQPYDPPPEFDRFTDPAYDGPIRPEMSLRPYRQGTRDLAQEDLEHLVGLYDGNLLMADDAVGRVLDALRETGRWDNTLFVLTSDHGEAFMEHGHQGHNSTLYDEMLHVPLIVRLPGGGTPAGVDPERLAWVGDVVPTVLGRLGIAPEGAVAGIDLLGSPPDGKRPRIVFARTSHPGSHGFLSARTPRWKAVARPGHRVQMLFDTAADPGETENLIDRRPLLYAGLGLLLRDQLEAAARGPAGEELVLPDEEADTLRSLGYVD